MDKEEFYTDVLGGVNYIPFVRRQFEELLSTVEKSKENVAIFESYVKKAKESKTSNYSQGQQEFYKDNSEAMATRDYLIYEGIYPDNIKDITQKHGDRDAVIKNAINSSSIQYKERVTPLSKNTIRAIKKVHNLRGKIGTPLADGEKDTTVTLFDLETIGGKNKSGINEIMDIYDYGFNITHRDGSVEQFTNVIGIEQNSKSHVFMQSIINDLKAGKELTEQQKLTYEYISRFGYSIGNNKLEQKKGRFISPALTDVDKNVFQSIESMQNGINVLVDIGKKQNKEKGVFGGYKYMIDDLITISNMEDNVMLGHNVKRFDIPAIRYMIMTNPELRSYAEQKGLDIEKTFKYTYDTLELANAADMRARRAFYEQIFPNGINAINPGGTELQAESLYVALFGRNGVHHGANNDSFEEGAIAGFKYDYESNEVKGMDTKFTNMLEEKVLGYYDTTKDVLSETSNMPKNITVMARQGESIYSTANSQNVFMAMNRDNGIYTSDGVEIYMDEEDKIVSNVVDEYNPSLVKTDTLYDIDMDSFRTIDNEKTISALGMTKQNIAASQRLIAFEMTQKHNKSVEGTLNKANKKITVFVPEEEFGNYWNSNFVTTAVDGKMTDAGYDIYRKIYGKDTEGLSYVAKDKGVGKQLDKLGINKLSDALDGKFIKTTEENISRNLTIPTLSRGLLIRQMADKGGIHLDTLNRVIYDLVHNIQGPNAQKAVENFNKVVSGISLTDDILDFGKNVFGENNILDASTWQNAWMIKGRLNEGWMDNSILSSRYIAPGSIGADEIMEFARAKASGAYSGKEINELFNQAINETIEDLGKPFVENGNREAYFALNGITSTNRFGANRIDKGIREFYVPSFVKILQSSSYATNMPSTVKLNLNNTGSSVNSVFRTIGMDLKNEKINPNNIVVNSRIMGNFIRSLLDDSFNENNVFGVKGDVFEDDRNRLLKIANNDKMSARDKMEQLLNVLQKKEYRNNEAFIPYTSSKNIITSTIFTNSSNQQATDKKSGKTDRIGKVKAQTILNGGIKKKSEKEMLEEYILGGNKAKIEKEYKKRLSPIKSSNKEAYTKRVAIFEKQLADHLAFGDKLIKSLEKCGADIVFSNDRIVAKMNGREYDVGSLVPKLRTNGGTTYTKLGGISYTTSFVGSFDAATGRINAKSALEVASGRLFSQLTPEKINTMQLSGENVVERILQKTSKAFEVVRSDNILRSNPMKDFRINASIVLQDALKNANYRKNLLVFLENQKGKSPEILKAIEELSRNPDKDLEYVNSALKNSFITLLHKGVIPSEFSIGKQSFTLGTKTKDTQLSQYRFSMVDTKLGLQGVENQMLGGSHVEENAIRFTSDFLKKQGIAADDLVQSSDDIVIKDSNGIETTNKVAVKHREITSYTKEEILNSDRVKKMGLSEEQLKRIREKVNTIEGSAYFSGRVLEQTGYIEGQKTLDISRKDLINKEQIKQSRSDISLDKNGNIKVKYGRGFVVSKGSHIIEAFSTYSGESSIEAKRSALVKEKYFLGNSEIALTEQEAQKYIQKKALAEYGEVNLDTAQKVVDRYLEKRLMATPIFIPGMQKVKDITGEKHNATLGLGSLNQIANDSRMSFLLGSTEINKISDYLGEEFNGILNKEVFDDFVSGELQHPVFDILDNQEKENLREKITKERHAILIENRYGDDDAIRKIFEANYISLSTADMLKHKNVNKEFEVTYNALIQKGIEEGMDKASAIQKAFAKINNAFISNITGIKLTVDTETGTLLIPDQYEIDLNELEKIRKDNNITLGDLSKPNSSYVEIVKNAGISEVKAAIDSRIIGRATNQVFDENLMRRVKRNMKESGFSKREIDATFGSIIDDNYQFKKHFDRKYEAGLAVLDSSKDFKDFYSATFKNGEQVFNIYDKKNAVGTARREVYERAKRDGAPLISEEYVDEVERYEKSRAANSMHESAKNGDEEAFEKLRKENGYQELRLRDGNVDYDFRKSPEAFKKSENVLWKKDAILDITDEALGLDKEFFESVSGNGKLVIPKYDPYQYKPVTRENRIKRRYQSSISKIQKGIDRRQESIKKLEAKIEDVKSRAATGKINFGDADYKIKKLENKIGHKKEQINLLQNTVMPDIEEKYQKKLNRISSNLDINDIELKDRDRSIPLKEYQNKASGVISTYNRIKDLNGRLQETTNSNDRIILQKKMEDQKDLLKNQYIEYQDYLKQYTESIKVGGLLESRLKNRMGNASHTSVTIFNTAEWADGKKLNEERVGEAFGDLMYKGRSLADAKRHGDNIEFVVASTEDLNKYGFTDDYFNKLGVDKDIWLKEAKKNGIEAISTRFPEDYYGSTRATRLYFSDNVNKGSIVMNSVTAMLLKADVDGDKVTTFVLGAQSKNGFIDTLSARMMNPEENTDRYRVVQAANRLSELHKQSMAINTYGLLKSKIYQENGIDQKIGQEQYSENIKKKRSKVLAEAINGKIHSASLEYHTNEKKVMQMQQDWQTAKDIIVKNLSDSGEDISTKQDYELVYRGNDILNSLNDEDKVVVEKGMRSYLDYMQPYMVSIGRTTRNAAGEIDTPFDVIDMINTLHKSDDLNILDRDLKDGEESRSAKFRMSDDEVKYMAYLHESAKEGFLTPKKASLQVTDPEWQSLTKDVSGIMDDLIRYSGINNEKSQAAKNMLINKLTTYGKNVLDRNPDTDELDYGKLVQELGSDEKAHHEVVVRGVNTLEKLLSHVSSQYRKGGMYELRGHLIQNRLSQITHNTLDKDGKTFVEKFFNDPETMEKLEAKMNEIEAESRSSAYEDLMTNKSVVSSVKNAKRVNPKGAMNFADNILKLKSSKLAKNSLFLASSLMFAGFVGGNPAMPSGSEAAATAQPQQIQQIPPQSPGNLNTMRGGPQRGYIVNINAQSDQGNDYLGRAITKAVRNNYNNSQVNININSQEQTSMSYDQMTDYIEQSIF